MGGDMAVANLSMSLALLTSAMATASTRRAAG